MFLEKFAFVNKILILFPNRPPISLLLVSFVFFFHMLTKFTLPLMLPWLFFFPLLWSFGLFWLSSCFCNSCRTTYLLGRVWTWYCFHHIFYVQFTYLLPPHSSISEEWNLRCWGLGQSVVSQKFRALRIDVNKLQVLPRDKGMI